MSQAQQQATGLEDHGITNVARVYWNLSTPALYEEAVRRREGSISADGPLVCRTGQHTGRAPNDKFIVREPSSADKVAWGRVNRPVDAASFDALYQRMLNYCEGKELFVQDCYAGADPRYRLPVRIITEQAWHSLFSRHMFIEATVASSRQHAPDFTVIDLPGLTADPKSHGTNSEVFILLNFAKKLVLIGGTSYAGEIKKSIFTVMNYLLPLRNVMSMHCSANVGPGGDVALFFGLSGTGKTTLSSDPEPLRHRARERPDGRHHPSARPRGRIADREHARCVSAGVHRQRGAVRPGRSPEEHRDADRRRVRRAA